MSAVAEEPSFIDRDPQAVIAAMVAQYESDSGKTLFPAQVERLLVNLVAYRESLLRVAIQEAAKQNLVAFARAPMLDYLGELLGISRLGARPARCTMRVSFQDPAVAAFYVPPGCRVEAAGGAQFETLTAVPVALGATSVEFVAQAVEPGLSGNGYAPGQVSALIDELPVPVGTVANLTATTGGAEAEDDDRLRERIKLAPESFSWGSISRYRLAAMTAAPELTDVQVFSPRADGSVSVVLLVEGGVPPAETVTLVQDALDEPGTRMLGDRVTVVAATPVDYQLSVELDVLSPWVPDRVIAIARARLEALAARFARTMGSDIVPSIVKTALHDIDGLYDVRLLAPSALHVLAVHEWPRLTALSVTLGRVISHG